MSDSGKATFTLERQKLRAVLEIASVAASKDVLRAYLSGIFFKANHALTATSTDGHRMMRVMVPIPDRDGPEAETFVSREDVQRLLKLVRCKASEQMQTLTIEIGDGLRVSGPFETAELQGLDELRPPYDKAIPPKRGPKDRGPGLLGVDPKYLSDVDVLARFVSDSVTISLEDARKPIRIDARGKGIEATYVVMPLRGGVWEEQR